MCENHNDLLIQKETTCGTLLSELQKIWNEVGEPDSERDRMLLELEQECLEAYRRKVDKASQYRAQLRQKVADSEAELACICAALGERPVHIKKFEQSDGSLQKELEFITPQLEEMRKRKSEKRSQFQEVLEQICNIKKDIFRSTEDNPFVAVVDETDLSLKKLEGLYSQLHALQKEKSERTKQVLDHLNMLNSLCLVLGMDFKHTITGIHPSLDNPSSTKSVSPETIEKLSAAVCSLKEVKIQRMQKLQEIATTMVGLWSLMDTPFEEQQMFQNVTQIIASSEHEVTELNNLSLDCIAQAQEEVLRLQKMKSSKIKEVLLKKKLDLEDICRRAHMVAEEHGTSDCSIEAIESGAVDPSFFLENLELQILNAKEEAFSRKDILEKVEKWLAACEEECWLEEYNMDDNRYNAGRGTHLVLKRAEKARALVSKIPAMVEALTSKAKAWEREREVEFSYDGVRLLSMLEQYNVLKQEKEQERQRLRDQKKLQGQLITEQEALFGSKPSPSKSAKKVSKASSGGAINKTLLLCGSMLTSNAEKNVLSSHPLKKSNPLKHQSSRNQNQSAFMGPLPVPVNQHYLNAPTFHKPKSTPRRKPLSPMSCALPSETNTANILDNPIQNGAIKRVLHNNGTPVASPAKIAYAADDENTTPRKMSIPVPSTPATVSAAMHTAMTPGTPSVPYVDEDIEYSFEERRAGFAPPKVHPKSLLRV